MTYFRFLTAAFAAFAIFCNVFLFLRPSLNPSYALWVMGKINANAIDANIKYLTNCGESFDIIYYINKILLYK